MGWLDYLQIFWPIAASITPIVLTAGLLWLKTQFPSKADLESTRKEIVGRIDAHQHRLDQGSDKLADLTQRLAVVEEECDSQPTKNDLNQGMSVISGRVSGVESAVKGLDDQLKTANGYLRTLIEQGLRK